MIKHVFSLKLLTALIFAVVLTACGGGGGDTGGGNQEEAVWDNTNWNNMTWQ